MGTKEYRGPSFTHQITNETRVQSVSLLAKHGWAAGDRGTIDGLPYTIEIAYVAEGLVYVRLRATNKPHAAPLKLTPRNLARVWKPEARDAAE